MRVRNRVSTICAFGVLATFIATHGLARAQDRDGAAEITRAQSLIRAFEYREAIAVLEDLITREPAPEQELRARQLLVQALASEGDQGGARRAAERLYARDPGYRMADEARLSPRIRSVLAEVALAARNAPPAEARALIHRTGEKLAIDLAAQTGALVSEVELFVRSAGEAEFERVESLEGEGTQRHALVELHAPIEYYVRYRAPSGHVVAALGSEDAPISWSEVTGEPGANRSSLALGGPVEPEDEGGSLTPWLIGGGIAVAIAIGVVALLVWEPWVEDPTIDQEIQLP